ncbi:MAG TPA: SpoIIE family protein phosphatase [Bryobacteraceae bacterium]|jgi:sigma-B regulation protein RsbU (phosphoserine phosphatase)|nr:SpoIIE family protein phosphatase [Bryobacteraceae bacterium]
MRARLTSLYRKLGRIEKTFLFALVLAIVLAIAAPATLIELLVTFAVWILGFIVAVRLARTGVKKLIWSLRNRLIVAYAFIAMVPIGLILALVLVSTYWLTGQIAIYLVNSELDRRTSILRGSAATILETAPVRRTEVIQRTLEFTQRFFPAAEILVRDGGELRYPPSSTITAPPAGWKDASGIVVKDAQMYSWANATGGRTDVVIMAPISQGFLASLLPGLGQVNFFSESGNGLRSVPGGSAASHAAHMPPKYNLLDMQVDGVSLVPVMFWNAPANKTARGLLLVNTRMSAVLSTLFGNNVFLGDMAYGQVIWALFLIIVTLFLIVELVSLVIGVSISRTITSAVHELYEGTRRVKVGDFSHRIPVRGNDQLAELGASFNTMTENLERLIIVAKEKERLQSELEIAREVQTLLFPKDVPGLKTLTLTGVCKPARVVSGDYYDFMRVDSSVAFAIGDVAGKGISAALLMASIQSTMRMQLTAAVPAMAGAGGAGWTPPPLSTAIMVSRLNKLLYANTSPEKYATFYFALYDEATQTLRYTNAGHLQPILLRKGVPELLEVTGTVVGAFPFSCYEERTVRMYSGDVLVAYTDGMIEPENEYGEMFGEQRLTDLLAKNVDRDSPEIIARSMEAVLQWSGDAAELSDDMTMLVARRP